MKTRDIFRMFAIWEYDQKDGESEWQELIFVLCNGFLFYIGWRVLACYDPAQAFSVLGSWPKTTELMLFGCVSGLSAFVFGNTITKKCCIFQNISLGTKKKVGIILQGGLTLLIPAYLAAALLTFGFQRLWNISESPLKFLAVSLGGVLFAFLMQIPAFFVKGKEKRYLFRGLHMFVPMVPAVFVKHFYSMENLPTAFKAASCAVFLIMALAYAVLLPGWLEKP